MNTPHKPNFSKKRKPGNRPAEFIKNDPRLVACAVVQQVLRGNAGTQAALDTAFSKQELALNDKALCTQLVYGSLRQYLRLQWFLRNLFAKPDTLPPEMLTCLSVAAYELFFTRVPAYATINSYVNIIRQRFGQHLSPVANGVLRNCDRQRHSFFAAETYEKAFLNPAERIACLYSMPQWIVDLWLAHYGSQATAEFLEASANAAPSALRLHKSDPRHHILFQLLSPMSLALEPHVSPLCLQEQTTLAFNGPLPPEAQDILLARQASQQSAASQEVLYAIEPTTWPGPIWDACAGRGGKTLALLELGLPVTLASDISSSRLKGLQAEIATLVASASAAPELEALTHKLSADTVTPADLEFLPPSHRTPSGQFGTILVDAPCSGLGTLARHPEIRLRRTAKDLATLEALQAKILSNLAMFVVPGGLMIYITCTLNPAENEQQVSQFLRVHPEFTLESQFQTPSASPLKEFFWAARLRKK